MPEITWAHVAILFLLIALVLGVIALLYSDKELELKLKASSKEFVLKTKHRSK